MNSVAVITCGKSKLDTTVPVEAWRLYTGGYFNKMLEAACKVAHNVLIVSAYYGVLNLNDLVLPYELKMTLSRAKAIHSKQLMVIDKPCIYLGAETYKKAIRFNNGKEDFFPNGFKPMGKRMGYVKTHMSELPVLCNPSQQPRGAIVKPMLV